MIKNFVDVRVEKILFLLAGRLASHPSKGYALSSQV